MSTREPTAFEERVYRATGEVPTGSVVTYGELARYLRCASPRAVGQALRRNPFAPRVPCHRVIASDRSLGGFRGSREREDLLDKRNRLRSEGVRFDADGRVDEDCIHCFG